MWRSVETTVRNVLLPSLADDWAKVAAIQLVGMVRYATNRPADPTDDRAAELAALLDGLAANDLVAGHWPAPSRSAADVLAATSAVLAAAVTRDDAAGDEVRQVVRAVVRRQLDDELAVTEPMMPYFRGQLPEGAADA
jgi:hypothetical protein